MPVSGIILDPYTLTAKRLAKAARAFLNQARRQCGHYPPATIVTDKAPTYPAIIQAMGTRTYFSEPVKHINKKWQNYKIESDLISSILVTIMYIH